MNKLFLPFLFSLFFFHAALGQPSRAERDSIAKYTKADYRQMLSQLGLKENNMRPGASGDPESPNAANRFEDKVNRYTLPDPLVLKTGKKVTTADVWWKKRRPEIVGDFEREIYGRLPKNIPPVRWEVVSVKDTVTGSFPVRQKLLKGIVDNRSYPSVSVEIELLVTTPGNVKEAVPVAMEFGFPSPPSHSEQINPSGLGASGEPAWKEQLLSKGWGYAVIAPASIQADNGAGLTKGIIGLVNKGKPRKPEDWGTLRAWAWGAGRAMDYLETDKDVDAKRVAIEGLSRYGKAALVTMAFEPRFSLGFIGSSGAGGAKILRRIFGEQVENLASSGEYHWFCGNFIKYAGPLTPNDLPVDAHELIALCAPRPVFISSGSPYVEGQWVDAMGTFIGGVHAGPVYKLLDKSDLGTTEFPVLGTALIEGEIAFRQHAGGHSTGPNWSTWIAWAGRYWGKGKYYDRKLLFSVEKKPDPSESAHYKGSYRNLFLEAGYSEAAISKKIEKTYSDLFEGPNRIYFEVGDSMGYVSDLKNHDVRTEGLSYGMMIAVQLNKKDVFDRIWRWSKTYLQHQNGPRKAYFAWSYDPKAMKRNSEGSASDGELYYITSLLFASNRWGNDTGIKYYAEARKILDAMWEKDGTENICNLINVVNKQITFVPEGDGYNWTDPSYQLPAFFEIWAEYAKDGHEQFYRDCADTSRAFLHRACHPVTGLNPDYAEFSGKPHSTHWMPAAFRYDSWRVPMNIAMDYIWYGKDKEWQEDYAARFQNFLRSKGINNFEDQFNLDGSRPDFILKAGEYRKLRHSLGLVATAAAVSLVNRDERSFDFVRALWNARFEPYDDGYFDPYYDGLLYLFSLIHLSGKYQIITP